MPGPAARRPELGSATAVGRFETVRVVDGGAYLDFGVGFSEKLGH